MKYRVLESKDGFFYPQFKPGFFSSWRYFQSTAETSIDSGWMFQRSIETFDPSQSTRFEDLSSAQSFNSRVHEKSRAYWANKSAQRQREIQGIDVNKVHKSP